MQIVLILLGMVLGAAASDGGAGVALGGVVGWLVARSLRQQREITALTQRLADAAGGAAATSSHQTKAQTEAPTEAPAGAPTEAPAEGSGATGPAPAEAGMPAYIGHHVPAAVAPAARVAAPDAAAAGDASPSVSDSVPSATPPTPPTPPTSSGWLDTALQRLRESLFGGNTIVKAGVAILFVGLAFLAKYASEHVTLPVELRLAAIAAVAMALLVLGWRLRERRAGYAQVLQGGAVAALYLTLFAAFRYHGLVGAAPTFVLMAAVAVLAAALAVLQDARSLAVVGTIGGYATPLLVSTGAGNMVALFAWYLVLGGGVLAVAWWRTWRELNVLAFLFTFGVGTAWGVLRYQPADYPASQTFLVLFFLLFVAVLLLPARRAAGDASARWINGSLLFGLPTVTFGLQYGLVKDLAHGPALAALALAAFYVGLAAWLRGRVRAPDAAPQLALAFEGCLAVGTVFLTLVIPLALDARSTAGAWALEGAGLVWLGLRQQRRLPRALGYTLLAVAGFLLLHAMEHHAPPTGVPNATLLAGLMLVAGSLVAAFVVHRLAAPAATPNGVSERIAEPLLIGWALLALLSLSWLHVRWLVDAPLRLAAVIACTGAVALGCTLLATRLAWRGIAWPVLALAPLLLLFSLAGIDVQRQPFAQGGWWAWPVALAAHGVALRWASLHWPSGGTHATHVVGALVVAMLGAATGRGLLDAASGEAGSAWPWLGWMAAPALLLALLPWPRFTMPWPMRAAPRAYVRDAGALLAAGALLWTLLANAISNGHAAPLPYVPFLNPLDIGIALALVAAARWMLAPGPGAAVLQPVPAATPALLGLCTFVWLNAMLVRGFHHLGGVPFTVRGWSASLAVQTGLTLLWSGTALALMWASARRGLRAPWMVGAGLLGVVVAKLLLVDLSGSGTVTRIVSFMGAGALMLVIGYVAPLPGRAGQAAEKATPADGDADARA